MRTLFIALQLLSATAVVAEAQQTRIVATPRARIVADRSDDRDRPYLGISLSSGSARDTLGILIESVTAGSPAEKAGLEEGNRIGAINGVTLKLTRDDIGDAEMASAMMNRLTRELRKAKVGDEVTLDIWTGGRYKNIKIKTASAESFTTARLSRADVEERAVIGVSLTSTGSKRDAEGVFVSAVTDGGPAEKAGIVEGERIASINGVDLRVAKEDLGESAVASAKVDRLQRELRKVKAGDVVELQVVAGGRTRTVKVTTAKASALPSTSSFRIESDGNGRIMMVPGGMMSLPRVPAPPRTPDVRIVPGVPAAPMAPSAPRVRIYRDFDPNDGIDVDVKAEVQRALDQVRTATEGVRVQVGPEVRRALETEMPRAMNELRESLNGLRMTMPTRTMRRTIII